MISLGTGAALQFTAQFWTYDTLPPELDLPNLPAPLPAPPIPQQPVALVGLAAAPVIVNVPADIVVTVTIQNLLQTALNMQLGIAVPGAGPSQPNCDAGASSSYDTRNPPKRRSVPACQSSEIMFGGYDSNRFSNNLHWFPVAAAVGSTLSSLWLLSLRNVQVGPAVPSTVAQIVDNPSTNPKLSMDTIQLDTTCTYILLTATRVATIYYNMGSSNFRIPTTTNPFWTYRCSTPSAITFEFVDISNNAQLLTMNSEDFYHGLSLNSPGWCIGSIQELPSGATQQLMGLSFFHSFYIVLQYDKTLTQSYEIAFAVNRRSGDA